MPLIIIIIIIIIIIKERPKQSRKPLQLNTAQLTP